jgi:hypothetical protein
MTAILTVPDTSTKFTVHERGRAVRIKDELIKLGMEADFAQAAS